MKFIAKNAKKEGANRILMKNFVHLHACNPSSGTIMDKVSKTNAARLLDSAKIAYELIPYEVDPDNLAAEHVAEELGEDIRCVFKTLVLHGDKAGYFVCVIPGNMEVDLKKAAKIVGEKKIEMIKSRELLPLTGYIHGGCSPVGMKKAFPTTIDESAKDQEKIFFSGGKIGCQIETTLEGLLKVVRVNTGDICTDE